MTKTIITSTNNLYRFIVHDEFNGHKVISRTDSSDSLRTKG